MTRRRRAVRVLGEALVVLLLAIFLIPFFMVVMNSAKTSKDILFDTLALPSNWGSSSRTSGSIFNNRTVHYANAFLDSTLITFFSLAVIVLFSSCARGPSCAPGRPWSTILFFVFVAAMVIPFQVLMFPLVRWMRIIGDFIHFRLLQSIPGIVFAYLGFGAPSPSSSSTASSRTFPTSSRSRRPSTAAAKRGPSSRSCSPSSSRSSSPSSSSTASGSGTITSSPSSCSANGAVQTIPLAVTAFAGAYLKQWDLILTSMLMAMLPVIVLYLFAQRYIIKGMIEGAIK